MNSSNRLHLFYFLGWLATQACVGAPSNAGWVARNGNASQTGHVEASFDPSLLQLDWTASLTSRYPIAVANGSVVVSTGSAIHLLDAETGEVRWEQTDASFREPTITGGNVYVPTGAHSSSCGVTCSESTYLRSYSEDDGTFRFRTPFSSQWSKGWGPVPYEDQIYMNGGYYGGVYRFSSSGSSFFKDLAQYSNWAPAVDDEHVYAYVAGHLQVLNRNTLNVVDSIPNPDYSWRGYSMNTIPVLAEDGDVIVRYGGRLMNFDIETSSLNWSKNASFSGQPVYGDGVVYAVSSGALSAIDKNSGEQDWAWEVTSDNLANWMLLTDSHIFVQTETTTYAVDLETGQEAWSYPASGVLAYDAGRLFISGDQVLSFAVIPEPCTASIVLIAICTFLMRRRNSAPQ